MGKGFAALNYIDLFSILSTFFKAIALRWVGIAVSFRHNKHTMELSQ